MNGMKLLNVRLAPADVRKAEALQKQGVEISTVVREAIRAEYERRRGRRGNGRKPSEIVKDIIVRNPAPPDEPPRDYNVHHRHEARAAILKKFSRRRSA